MTGTIKFPLIGLMAVLLLCISSLPSQATTVLNTSLNSDHYDPYTPVSSTFSGEDIPFQNPVGILISDATANNSDEVCVSVAVRNFTQILGLQFTLDYDARLLQFKKLQNLNNSLGLFEVFRDQNFGLPGQGAVPVGKMTFLWTAPGASPSTAADGTVLFEVCFTVISGTGADAEIKLSNSPTNILVSDANSRPLEFDATDTGELTLNGGAGGSSGGGGSTGGTGLRLVIDDASGVAQGQQICLPVKVYNFNNVLGTQFSIAFDNTQLRFDNVRNLNNSIGLFDVFKDQNFGFPGQGAVPNNRMTFLWTAPGANALSLPDGTVLFEMCFTVQGSSNTEVTFNNTPTQVLVSGASSAPIAFTTENSSVGNVGDTGGGTGGGGSGDVTLTMADVANVAQGDQVCLAVTVSNFNNVLGTQFSVSFDNVKLRFDNVRNLNNSIGLFDVFKDQNFGFPGQGAVPNNRMTFLWTAPGATAISLPNGTVLFEVCFTMLGTTDTEVAFANTPTQILVSNANSAPLAYVTNNGSVTTGSGGGTGGGGGNPSPTDLTLELADISNVAKGDQVCLPVRVYNFNNVLGTQFSLSFDNAKLRFDNVKNLNNSIGLFDVFKDQNFGFPGQGAVPNNRMTFLWTAPGATAISLPNATVLFEVCFTVIGTTSTTVGFTNTPTQVLVSNGASQPISVVTNDATIALGGDTGGGGGGDPVTSEKDFEALTIELTDVANVAQGDQVCLKLRAHKFQNILGTQFSLSFDPTLLRYAKMQNLNNSIGLFDVFIDQNFGLPGQGAVPANRITFLWTAPGATPVNLPDGTVMFEVCFNVLGNTSTQVNFVNDPTQILVSGANSQALTAGTDPGVVTIGTGGGGGGIGTDNFLLEMGSDMVSGVGQQVCLDLKVYNFNNILGVQFTVGYNPSILRFGQVRNLNLTGLLPQFQDQYFGFPGQGSVPMGRMTFLWTAPSTSGVTVPDGTTIMEVCFTTLAEADSDVSFVSSPTQIIVTGGDQRTVAFETRNGTVRVGEIQPPRISNAAVTNVSCFGGSNGAITLTVADGSGNYTYRWNYQNRTTASLTGIPAGSYSVTVTDATSSLTTTGSYTVTQGIEIALGGLDVTNISCFGANDGRIVANASGGTGSLTFRWNNGLPNGATQSNLAPGTYTLTVVDGNGCTSVSGPVNITQPNQLIISSITGTNVVAGNDGAIRLNVSGGTPGYAYRWSGPGGYTSEAANPTGLNMQGEYCVTVTDQGNCTTSGCVSIASVFRIMETKVTRPCGSESNGVIEVIPTGGVMPYSFRWNTGSVASRISNLAAGTYSVTVSDQSGASQVFSEALVAFPEIEVSATTTQVEGIVSNKNGGVSLSVGGGAAPYTIVWNNGVTGTTLSNVGVGVHCAMIRDQNGCSMEACFEVTFKSAPLAIQSTVQNVACNGRNNGQINISIFGGVPPYTASFSDGQAFPSSSGLLTRSNLRAGTYSFTVTDKSGTSVSGQETISEPAPLALAGAAVLHDSEAPGCTGSIQLTIQGGNAPYTVAWGNGSTGLVLSNLCAGAYVATITDAKGCTLTTDSIRVNTFSASAVIVDNECPDMKNGQIDLSVSGGVEPYSFVWQDAQGNQIGTAADLGSVGAGSYTLRVTEASGNELSKVFVVRTLSNLGISVEVLTNFRGFGVSCPAGSNGSLRATGLNSDGNFAYEWTRDGVLLGTSATLSNQPAGVYTVMVSDGLGCTVTRQIELTAPPAITFESVVSAPVCVGSNTASIEVAASGGALQTGFTYVWSNGATGPVAPNLVPGTYRVTATDANNCRATDTIVVVNPEPLVVSVETTPAENECDGTATATVSGGTSPFTYRWNSNNAWNTAQITGLCPGSYFVEVSDANGCTAEIATSEVLDRRFPCLEERSVISPDGDGLNDNFIIFCADSEFADNRLEIFDRWGQLVFEAKNYDNSWTGQTPFGQELPEGPYYYILEYKDPNGNLLQKKGSITLLRE